MPTGGGMLPPAPPDPVAPSDPAPPDPVPPAVPVVPDDPALPVDPTAPVAPPVPVVELQLGSLLAGAPAAIHPSTMAASLDVRRSFVDGGGIGFWSSWMRIAIISYTNLLGLVTERACRSLNVTSDIGAP
jgi:hypothetical protein